MKKQEQLTREVKLFGNGAHIFVPKEWFGEKIMLIRPEKKTLKERIIKILEPHLDKIIGVYLCGSQARGEQQPDSDIDILIIASEKIKIKEKGLEIICIQESLIEQAIQLEPLLFYSMVAEAKPIINASLLKSLRDKHTPKEADFKEFIKTTKKFLEISQTFLAKEGEYISREAELYSTVLRARGIFSIKQLIKGKAYSHKEFKHWIAKNIPNVNFTTIYESYRKSKMNLPHKQKIKRQDLLILIDFLKKELAQ